MSEFEHFNHETPVNALDQRLESLMIKPCQFRDRLKLGSDPVSTRIRQLYQSNIADQALASILNAVFTMRQGSFFFSSQIGNKMIGRDPNLSHHFPEEKRSWVRSYILKRENEVYFREIRKSSDPSVPRQDWRPGVIVLVHEGLRSELIKIIGEEEFRRQVKELEEAYDRRSTPLAVQNAEVAAASRPRAPETAEQTNPPPASGEEQSSTPEL